jgi:hypothetical protein
MRKGSNLIGEFCGDSSCGRKASANLAVAVLMSCLPLVTCADEIDYAVTTQNQLGTVDLQTGAFTLLGSVNGIAGGEIGDIAREPGGLLYGMDSNSRLVLINPVALTTSLVGNTGLSIFALAFRPDGILFGLSSDGDLYTIDKSNGVPTLVAPISGASIASYYDIRFDSAGKCYLLDGSSTLYTLDVSSGQATLVGSIGYSVYNLNYDNGTLYGFTTTGQIISINTTTGAGTVVSTESEPYPIVAAAPGGTDIGAPTLSIQITNVNAYALSWVAPSNAFRLEQNTNLTTTNWIPVNNSVGVTNSLNLVVVSNSIQADFFRLINP